MSHKSLPKSTKLYLFGSFHAENETDPIPLSARKAQALLAYLVLFPQEHAREKLAALFWGDSPDAQARDSLRTALKTIRKHLGGDLLLADRETVQINPAFPLWVDVREFMISDFGFQIENQSTAPNQSEIINLKSKIELYRGDLLADFYDDWILTERALLRELYLNALLTVAQAARAAGEGTRAVELAQKLLAQDPTNESAHRELMLCFAATGKRSAALKQYEACVRAMRAELGVAPSSETTALYEEIKRAGTAAPAWETRRTNVPTPLTSFVGRKKEIEEIEEILARQRLVTLTGSGGSGKTRLAIQVATNLLNGFHDGVWWVDLAPLTDDTLVPYAVAQVSGVRESAGQSLTESPKESLRQKQLLLILDNCEHLIAACAQLADVLLTHCATVRIVATSREALGITGEMVYQVPTLSLPAQRSTPSDLLIEYEGIRLFVERACTVKSDFALTEQNAAAVLEICRRLDGIPLALELAAARTKLLSVEHIADRLVDRLSLLTQGSRTALPRQQTLRATMDWSYDLLPKEARLLFRRLSVFVGGFTLDAVQEICFEESLTPSAALDLLTRLVDRSLVNVEHQGQYKRYRLLETIREYALEKLDESGETEQLRQRQRDYFIAIAEQAEPKLKGAEQFEWLGRLELERDNLRAAWEYAIESDAGLAVKLASALFTFWVMGSLREGRKWLVKLVERTNEWGESIGRAHILGMAGWLAAYQRDLATARQLLEQALSIARRSGSKKEIAFALLGLSATAHWQNDEPIAQSFAAEALTIYQELKDEWGIAWALLQLPATSTLENAAEAEELYLQSLAKFRDLGDKFRVGRVLNDLGELMRLVGDYERAGKYYEEALEIFREAHGHLTWAGPLSNLAWVSLHQGDYLRARALLGESLELCTQNGDKIAMILCLTGFAAVLGMTGKPQQAARLFGAVESLFETIGMGGSMEPEDQKEFDHYVGVVRGQLSEAAFAKAWAEGRTLTLEQAIDYALARTKPKGKEKRKIRCF